MKRNWSQAFGQAISYGFPLFSAYSGLKKARTQFNLGSASNAQNSMARSRRFRRRLATRSRFIRKRRTRFRRRTIRSRIRRIWSFMRSKGLRNLETKYLQSSWSSTTTANQTPRVTILSNTAALAVKQVFSDPIPAGTGQNNRIGQKVLLKTLKLRLFFTAPPRHPTPSTNFVPQEVHIRFIVVREKESLGTTTASVNPSLYHILQNALGSGDADSPTTPLGSDSRHQFISLYRYYSSKFADNYTILLDRTIKVANEDGGDRYYRTAKYNINIMQPCTWDSANNRGDGHIYMFYWCDITSSPEVDSYIPLLQATYRLTFVDC